MDPNEKDKGAFHGKWELSQRLRNTVKYLPDLILPPLDRHSHLHPDDRLFSRVAKVMGMERDDVMRYYNLFPWFMKLVDLLDFYAVEVEGVKNATDRILAAIPVGGDLSSVRSRFFMKCCTSFISDLRYKVEKSPMRDSLIKIALMIYEWHRKSMRKFHSAKETSDANVMIHEEVTWTTTRQDYHLSVGYIPAIGGIRVLAGSVCHSRKDPGNELAFMFVEGQHYSRLCELLVQVLFEIEREGANEKRRSSKVIF